jgi:hypothetical protein
MSDSGTIQWVAAAAVIAALGTPAGAADLLPPLPPRHLPHRLLGHLPIVPQGHLPGASTGLPSGERADSAIVGWGANSTFMQMSVAFRGYRVNRRPADHGDLGLCQRSHRSLGMGGPLRVAWPDGKRDRGVSRGPCPHLVELGPRPRGGRSPCRVGLTREMTSMNRASLWRISGRPAALRAAKISATANASQVVPNGVTVRNAKSFATICRAICSFDIAVSCRRMVKILSALRVTVPGGGQPTTIPGR